MHRIGSSFLRHSLLVLGLLAALGTSARAQAPDTLMPVAAARADSMGTGSEYRMTKSPVAAVLYSIVPGGGQIYTEEYVKAALFVGAAGFLAYRVVTMHNRYTDFAAQVDALPDPDTTFTRERLRAQREFYRDNRDASIAYFIGVQILSMIDAYVSAHLFDFDVDNSEDGLSSRLYLDPERIGVGLSMRW